MDKCNEVDQHVIKMAALGRRFQLGDLYNYHIDCILTEYRCNSADLPSGTKTVTGFNVKLLCPDSDITHKWQHIGLDWHLQSSILAGLFETGAEMDKLSGTSHYVNDKFNPTEVTRTFICRAINRKEHLDLPQFLKNNFATNGKLPDATHIVVGIAYGAEAYCVLAQDVQNDDVDSREEVAELLAKVSSKMEDALEEKQGDIEFKKLFTKQEKKLVNQIKCRIYADLQTQPVRKCTLFDAYKHCLKLVDQVMTSNTGKAVPVVAVLCPLRFIMRANERLENNFKYRDVDPGLVARCCRITTELEQVISKSDSLRLSFKKTGSRPDLRQFIKVVSKFQDLLKKSWKKNIVKARESENEDDREVERAAHIAEAHPLFKISRLNQWLHFKQAELDIATKMGSINGITFLADKTQLEKELAFCFDRRHALVLYIPSLDQRSKDLLCDMKDYVDNYTRLVAGDDDSDEDTLPWHLVTSERKQVLDKIREMADHVKKNKHLENDVQFFILPEEISKKFQCSYSIYQAEDLLMNNVNHLPTPPTELQIQLDTKRPRIQDVSIQLKWIYEDLMGYRPCTFLVEYRPIGDPEAHWKQQRTSKPGQTQLAIILRQDSVFEIRVAAETCIGRSEFSEVIDTGATLNNNQSIDVEREERTIQNQKGIVLHPPILIVSDVTQTTADLVWTPSSNGAASVAVSYKIRYRRNGQRLLVHVWVDSGENQCRLEDLHPGSTYSINIVATSENGQESAPSKAVEFTTHQLQEESIPVGIYQNTFSTVVDELKLLRELVTNLMEESNDTKSALIETGFNQLKEKIKESTEYLTKRLQDSLFNSETEEANLALNKKPNETSAIERMPLLQGEEKIAIEKKWFDTIKLSNPNVKVIEDLILNGVDVNTKDKCGETALHSVCRNNKNENQVELVRLLIVNGVDVNAKDKYGQTALHFLCLYNKNHKNVIDVVRLLIENGVDIKAKTFEGIGYTALHFLCQSYKNENLIDIVRLFVKNRVDVNMVDNRGRTALFGLCQFYKNENLIDIVRLFVENGVDVNVKDNNGDAVLHILCRCAAEDKNLIDIVRLLVVNGLDVNVKDECGETPLHILCQYASNEDKNLVDIFRLLVENGVDVNAKANDGRTVLHMLCPDSSSENIIDVVRLLIKNGVERKGQKWGYRSPCHVSMHLRA